MATNKKKPTKKVKRGYKPRAKKALNTKVLLLDPAPEPLECRESDPPAQPTLLQKIWALFF